MKNNVWSILAVFGQVGLIIAIPVVICAYFGHKLDLKFNSSPLFILSGMGISLFVSSLAIYQMIKKIEGK
jgi:Na+/H+ antiporter NhaC